MNLTPYRGFRFPKAIIQHAIWLYLRFTLSLRDVEELLGERGIMVTYETVPGPGRSFRAADRQATAPPARSAEKSLASRRDLLEDRPSADVPVAGHFCAANPTPPSGSIPTVSAD